MRAAATGRMSVIAAVIVAGVTSAGISHAACDVKIGVMGPLSGPAASWGIAVRSGAEFAVAEVNKAGGLQVGREKCQVVLSSYDSKYTAQGAAAGANYFNSQGVKMIVGPIGSPENTGVKPVAERNEQLTFNTSYAKDAIGPQWPLAFHQLSGPATWAPPIAKAAKEKFGFKSIVVVAPNDQGGTDIASVDAASYRAIGVQATEEYYQRGTTNFAPIVTRILSFKPEAVDTASSPPGDAATMVKQLREAGFKGPIGRLGGPGTPEIIRAAGGVEALGNFYWLDVVPVEEPGIRALWALYEKQMGQPGPDNSLLATSVVATRMYMKAVEKAGTSTDAKKIAAALRTLPVEDPQLGRGAWAGQKTFGINQELAFPVGMGLIVNGKNLGVSAIDVTTK